MTFAVPWILAGLLPWAGLVVWVWRRGANTTATPVPHVQFWPRDARATRPTRRGRPPLDVLLWLLSALLALLAASGPQLTALSRLRVTIVVDRGITAAPQGRVERALSALRDEVDAHADRVDYTVLNVPPTLPAAAYDARAEVGREVARLSLEDTGPILVLSDHPPERDDVLGVQPALLANAAILDADVFGDGLRVTVRNDSMPPGTPAAVRLRGSDGREQKADLLLPAAGELTNAFFYVGEEIDAVTVELAVAGDGWAGDDVFHLAMRRSWPRLTVESGPASVERVARVFGELRPAMPWADEVRVTTSQPNMEGNAIWLAAGDRPVADVRIQEAAPPATAVPWQDLEGLRASTVPDGWRPLVTADDGVTLLADRLVGGRRQLWVGFDAEGFSQSAEYVRFWADAFAWVGGEPAWEASVAGGRTVAVRDAAAGLSRDGGGRPTAANLPRVAFAPEVRAADLAGFLLPFRTGLRLAPVLAGLAAVGVVAGAWVGRRRGRGSNKGVKTGGAALN